MFLCIKLSANCPTGAQFLSWPRQQSSILCLWSIV